MTEEVDRQALLTTLTTEHFTLQGARASTVSESSARSALYLGSLSASLVSLGFVSQTTAAGSTFRVFALVVLPTLFLLGLFTFVRLVETSIEDIRYGRAINRIRNYYVQLAGPESRYFLLDAHDDAAGVLRNMGVQATPIQLYLTSSAAIAVVNSVVGGKRRGARDRVGIRCAARGRRRCRCDRCRLLGRDAHELVAPSPRADTRRGALPEPYFLTERVVTPFWTMNFGLTNLIRTGSDQVICLTGPGTYGSIPRTR